MFDKNHESLPNPIVHVYNEWDPLEEVIVGTLAGATIPEWHVQLKSTMPKKWWKFYQENGGKPFPKEMIDAGEKELKEFIKILEGEGVKVRRPDAINYSRPYATMNWQVKGGMYAAMPRDFLLVVGNKLIESPLSWRSRHYENDAYRGLLKEYFLQGAEWIAAPKPQLLDELYDKNYREPLDGEYAYSLTEFEPIFEAADFVHCGKHLFVQRSNTTNQMGIEWLRRTLGKEFIIYELEVNDPHSMHIDTTFLPIAPGKILINKDRFRKIPPMFKGWDFLEAPKPNIPEDYPLYMTSGWISMNIMMLDEKRAIIEAEETNMIKALKSWGFTPIPCKFRHFNSFGGSFHCATAEIRRRGDGAINYFE